MKLFLKTKDFSVSGEEFELHYDSTRDILVTQPQPKNLSDYYDSESYISHTDSKATLVDKIYQKVKRYSLRKKLQIIDNQDIKYKSLLDVGAGTGDFLALAKEKGWDIEGVEPNPSAREKAENKGVRLTTNLDELSERKFDVITLWHVLEHLPELDEQIEKLQKLLKQDGLLVVAVPNYKSWDAAHYGRYWAAYDVPRHLWHFSRTSISKIFGRKQMKVEKVRPMVFDAFYVSLLSEKYKGAKWYLVNAFFIGLWSNFRALFSKEYSSLIYLIKKAN